MSTYRPSCQASSPSQCSTCSLAYDCARKRSGQRWLWPATALVALCVMGLLNYVA